MEFAAVRQAISFGVGITTARQFVQKFNHRSSLFRYGNFQNSVRGDEVTNVIAIVTIKASVFIDFHNGDQNRVSSKSIDDDDTLHFIPLIARRNGAEIAPLKVDYMPGITGIPGMTGCCC